MSSNNNSEESRFKCHICDRSYKQKDSLMRHNHNHQNRQRHTCLHCGHKFPRRDTMQRHVNLHHKGRLRGVRACDRCRSSKIKCNSQQPCSTCTQAHRDCTYMTPVGNKPSIPPPPPQQDAAQCKGNSPSTNTNSFSLDGDPGPRQGTNTSISSWSDLESAPVNGLIKRTQNSFSNSTIGNTSSIVNATSGCIISAAGMLNTEASLLCDDASMLSPWSSSEVMPNGEFLSNPAFFATDPTEQVGIDSSFFDFDDDLNIMIPSSLNEPPVCGNIGQANHFMADITEYARPLLETVDVQERPSGINNEQTGSTLSGLIQDIVSFAIQEIASPTPHLDLWQLTWREFSTKIEQFHHEANITCHRAGNLYLLEHFCQQFLSHFNTLWPLIRPTAFSSYSTHPLLYLTMATIGAMYSGPEYKSFGLMMHEKLRISLLSSPQLYQHPSLSLECLQAMLLTQIATLYFGPQSAIFIAQQLGGLIVNHARQIGVFSGRVLPPHRNMAPTLEQWCTREATIRFAFGSFRAEIFVSYLCHTRAMLSPEELNLSLPCRDELWTGEVEDQQKFIQTWPWMSDMLYSDLVRIAVDRHEVLPDLSAAHRDLILFGIQDSVWRFSNDPNLFSRMRLFSQPEYSIGSDLFTHAAKRSRLKKPNSICIPDDPGPSLEVSETHDHLEKHRQMADLQQEHDRTLHFLREWKNSYIGNQSSQQLAGHRFNLLNSRLLYHLSFMRLRGNIPNIGFVASYLHISQAQDQEEVVEQVWQWSQSVIAENALQHACAIWVLVSSEYTWNAETRARFNILCLLALHFAGKVIWAYAGTHTIAGDNVLKIPKASTKLLGSDLLIIRNNSKELMRCFQKLVGLITKGWISWFPTAATSLTEAPFPPSKKHSIIQGVIPEPQSEDADHLS